jgi:hypothetical protein
MGSADVAVGGLHCFQRLWFGGGAKARRQGVWPHVREPGPDADLRVVLECGMLASYGKLPARALVSSDLRGDSSAPSMQKAKQTRLVSSGDAS